VSRIFGGVLRTTVQCRECLGRSSRTTPFTELSLAFDDDDDGDGNDDGNVDGNADGNMVAMGTTGGEEEGVDVSTLSTDGGPSHKRTKTREAFTTSVSTSSTSSAASASSASTSLPAPPPRSLQAMVARYFKPQHLTGDDRYFCEACGRKVCFRLS
jgi:ubiquitin C-terminal hydrolase